MLKKANRKILIPVFPKIYPSSTEDKGIYTITNLKIDLIVANFVTIMSLYLWRWVSITMRSVSQGTAISDKTLVSCGINNGGGKNELAPSPSYTPQSNWMIVASARRISAPNVPRVRAFAPRPAPGRGPTLPPPTPLTGRAPSIIPVSCPRTPALRADIDLFIFFSRPNRTNRCASECRDRNAEWPARTMKVRDRYRLSMLATAHHYLWGK